MAKRPILRAQAAMTATEDVIEDEKPPVQETLDEAPETGQSSRTGKVSDGDEAIQRIAARLGHRPIEQWERDPSKWKDARTFLEEMPDQFAALRERNRAIEERIKRTTQAAADAVEDANRRARVDLQAEIAAAAKAGDEDAAAKAAQRLAQIPAGPPPQTRAWLAKNQWFETDPDAKAIAVAIVNRKAEAGETIEEQLKAAEMAVRKVYPEHFDEPVRQEMHSDPNRDQPRMQHPVEEKTEVRLSESRRVPQTPPAVSAGSRGGTGTPKERGYLDIPNVDRSAFERTMLRKLVGRGLEPDEAKSRYARSYWKTTGE